MYLLKNNRIDPTIFSLYRMKRIRRNQKLLIHILSFVFQLKLQMKFHFYDDEIYLRIDKK